MTIIYFFIKIYIVILMFRYVATQQELNFNPLGRVIAYLTNPLFNSFKVSKQQSDRFIPMLILVGIVIAGFLTMLFSKSNIILSFFSTISNFLLFFMLLFMVCVLLGNFAGNSMIGHTVVYFYRLGFPWVKLTRTFIPLSSNKIIYPTIFVIFLIYVCANFAIVSGIQIFSGGIDALSLSALLITVKAGLLGITDLLYYLSWIVIARALLSWVSPDVRNPIVQLIYVITEPILIPFRRLIPSIGVFDFSAFVAILVLSIGTALLQKLIIMFL